MSRISSNRANCQPLGDPHVSHSHAQSELIGVWHLTQPEWQSVSHRPALAVWGTAANAPAKTLTSLSQEPWSASGALLPGVGGGDLALPPRWQAYALVSGDPGLDLSKGKSNCR